MLDKEPLELAQLIVRGEYLNFSWQKPFIKTSGIYRFTNEDITSYFHHLENKKEVLTVIGSGCQVINGILAGTKSFDCFDISIFPEYYLYLQLASILSLSKEDYLKYHFSDDREELFCDELYDKISVNLKGKYKEFWDTLYMFDDGIDIYNSLLFRRDVFLLKFVLETNPYLQENNYEKLKHILQTNNIKINTMVEDIITKKIEKKYDLINLSNILSYYYNEYSLDKYVDYLKTNFNLTDEGEIINYFYKMSTSNESKLKELLQEDGYIEKMGDKRLVVYKKKVRCYNGTKTI